MSTIKSYHINQPAQSAHQRDLISLRVSIARLAQAAEVETDDLPVLRKPYNVLHDMACNQSRGWHRLILRVMDVIDPITVGRKEKQTNVPTSIPNPNQPV
jgi:hypothetical protein